MSFCQWCTYVICTPFGQNLETAVYFNYCLKFVKGSQVSVAKKKTWCGCKDPRDFMKPLWRGVTSQTPSSWDLVEAWGQVPDQDFYYKLHEISWCSHKNNDFFFGNWYPNFHTQISTWFALYIWIFHAIPSKKSFDLNPPLLLGVRVGKMTFCTYLDPSLKS